MMAKDYREPESTDDTLYLRSDATFAEIIEATQRHFGAQNISEFRIDSEHVQVQCFGYDLYDGSDWRQYLVISR